MEQNQFASKADVDVIKNQLDQLVEAMTALARRDENIQRTVRTENGVPPQVNNLTQTQPV